MILLLYDIKGKEGGIGYLHGIAPKWCLLGRVPFFNINNLPWYLCTYLNTCLIIVHTV